jgi:CBS domain-containing protein
MFTTFLEGRRNKLMATISDILRVKGNQVWSIPPETSVLDALKVMRDKDVGALLVMEAGNIMGIVSERDFMRSVADKEKFQLAAEVQDYMTREVITIEPGQSIEECMRMMTKERIRHLPVVDNKHVIGLISIGDVVKELISDKESLINNLENYIQGRGYGH